MNVANIDYVYVNCKEQSGDTAFSWYYLLDDSSPIFSPKDNLIINVKNANNISFGGTGGVSYTFYVTEIDGVNSTQKGSTFLEEYSSYIFDIYMYQEVNNMLDEDTVEVRSFTPGYLISISQPTYFLPIAITSNSNPLYVKEKEYGQVTEMVYRPNFVSVTVNGWSEDNETLGWPVVNIPTGEKELEYSLNEFLNSWDWESAIGAQAGWISNNTNINKMSCFTNNSDKLVLLYTDENNYRTVGVGETLSFNPAINVIKFRINTNMYPEHADLERWLNIHIKNKLSYKIKDLAYKNILNRYKDFSPIVFFWEKNNYQFPEGEQIIVNGQDREVYFSMRDAVSMDMIYQDNVNSFSNPATLVLKNNNKLTVSRGMFLNDFRFIQETKTSNLILKECKLKQTRETLNSPRSIFASSNLTLNNCKIENYNNSMGLINLTEDSFRNEVDLTIKNCYIKNLFSVKNYIRTNSFRNSQVNNNYIIQSNIALTGRTSHIFNNNIIENLGNSELKKVLLKQTDSGFPEADLSANNNYFLGQINITDNTQASLLKNRNFYYLQ